MLLLQGYLMSAISSDWDKPVPGGLAGLVSMLLSVLSSDRANPLREILHESLPGEYLATGHPKQCSRFVIRFHILVSATDDPSLFFVIIVL